MFIKKQLLFRFLIGIMVGLFSVGCADNIIPTPIVVTLSVGETDRSPFTGIPCVAPCWQGLEVGKSNEKDVLAVLQTLTFINQDSIQVSHTSMPSIDGTYAPGVIIVAECANSSDECLTLRVVDDILTRIVIKLNYEINQNEAIEALGNPDYVGTQQLGVRVICEVYLIWNNSNLVLASRFEGIQGSDEVEKNCDVVFSSGKIPSDFVIEEVRYLSDAELSALLRGSGNFFEYTGTTSD